MNFDALIKVRSCLLGGAAILVLSPGTVWAQTADTTGELETVVVSSTRLQNAGFDAPTPTQTLNASDLAAIAQPNLFDAVIQMPALQGSTGTTYEDGSTSTGLQGLSTFALRGLSPLRTLTLIDSERIVGSNYNGSVDVSLLPQMLVQRVDVVTGGASASWGSDAVAGVVNFVTDKKFDGFKLDTSYGQSTYDDNKQTSFKFAAGTGFGADRGHIEVAGEYLKDQGVIGEGPQANNYGCGGPNGRVYNNCAGATNTGSPAATAAGQPMLNWGPVLNTTQESEYGLITSAGPLQGTAFGVNGQPYKFNYSGGGVPTPSGGVTGCVGSTCLGTTANPGDLSGIEQAATLVSPLQRSTLFTRISWDITPTSEIYTTFNWGESDTITQPNTGYGRPANLSISNCQTNPFVPATIATACAADGITSMTLGGLYPFPSYDTVNILRDQRRFVIGGDGSFEVFGKKWTWDTYAEYGESDSNLHITNIQLTPNVNAAINAIVAPNGQIECASAAARAGGCVPYDIFGNVQNTPAALQYIVPANGPFDYIFQRQEAFSANLNGKPFADWAGDVSVAIGVDYRLENYHSLADPYGNGTLYPNGDPYNAAYPANPLFSAAQVSTGGVWYAGNYHEGYGQYDVDEAFVEAGIPLYKSEGWGSLDADLAARFEHYSQSGNATTWKEGLVWETPLPGVRLRALQSADLRAPNLAEAFAPNNVINSTVTDPFLAGNPNIEMQQVNEGNPNLKPENSRTQEIGIVFQPAYVPGLRASADYYHVNVTHVISSLSSVQQIVNLCFEGQTAFCGQNVITTAGGVPFTQGGIPTQIGLEYFNLASDLTTGVDLEADYQFNLQNWGIPGEFAIRGLATKTYKFIVCQGIPGTECYNYAGALGNYSTSTAYEAIGGTIPTWKTVFTETWGTTWGSFLLSQRWFNAGTFENYYTVCTPGSCPVGTLLNPTINYNHMPGALYWDAGAQFNVSGNAQIYAKVNNIANLLPPPGAGGGGSDGGVNVTLYDVIGRMYFIGFRYHL